jgi:hypothetical protein
MDGDGGESCDVRRNVKAVTALWLHGKDGDGGENSDVCNNVKAVTALRLVSTVRAGDIHYKMKAITGVEASKEGDGGESGDVHNKVMAIITALRLVITETVVRAVTSIIK